MQCPGCFLRSLAPKVAHGGPKCKVVRDTATMLGELSYNQSATGLRLQLIKYICIHFNDLNNDEGSEHKLTWE